jgi:DNA repair protein RadC
MTQSANSFPSEILSNRLLVRDVDGQYRAASTDEVLSHAKRILARRVRRGAVMSSPEAVKDYLRLEIGVLEHEVFHVIFLDAQHRFIARKEMFRGTLTQTAVYPREIVKEALLCNAAAILCAHVHPSGHEQPSRADEQLTTSLRTALAIVDVRVLDHFVVTCDKVFSFSEAGLM